MRIAHVIETQQLRDARPLITALSLAAMIAISPARAQWQPSRNVEIIAPAAAGSSLDSMARLFQRVIQDKRLAKSSQTVVNKAGGGNAVGFNYLASHAADGHYVLVTPFTVITNRIMGSNPLSYQDFTPLAMLADEHIAFIVSANSPLKTGRDLLERLKKDPGAVSMALASALGNANHIAVCLVGKAVGADSKRFKIAVFNSSGESITAVLGGHVDLAITTVGLVGPHVQAGRIRVLGVAAGERLTGPLAQVPTWREQGADVVFSSWRALIGPRSLNAEQIAYWEALAARATEQEEWTHELEINSLTPAYMGSEATRKLFAQQAGELRSILSELGLAK
jgi:putative tricarboxylic transport membrane protein